MKWKMRYGTTAAIGCLLAGVVAVQTEDGLRSGIANLRYPRLPEVARIQGDVRLRINSGVIALLSGCPFLVPLSIENAKTFGAVQNSADLELTYHFVLIDTTSVPVSKRVKRGNALSRAVLRIFGFKTERVVNEYECKEGIAPPNEITIEGAAKHARQRSWQNVDA